MDINQFSISISKELLSALPTVEFPGVITVVETIEDALEALDYLKKCKVVGFDTETKPNFRRVRPTPSRLSRSQRSTTLSCSASTNWDSSLS